MRPSPGQVRIPLIKTAEGDRDYPVVLQYGGVLETVHPLRGVGFPFIKTLNINVELSQVRLRLPESFRWFYFRRHDAAGDRRGRSGRGLLRLQHAAGQTADAGLGHREPLRAGARGQQLETVGWPCTTTTTRTSAFPMKPNRPVQLRGNNVDALSRAQQETERYFQQEAQVLETDNRARLNTFFAEQANTLARNVVTDLDGNFKASVPPQATAEPGRRFPLRLADEEPVGSAQQLLGRRPE
jgi:hypothetical protein